MLKDFSKGEKAVYGVFTHDYRINALEARILVTVPACLEILLFSPAHRDWVKKLRYVIFDEVHCMREGGIREGGTVENTGAIWEHCLLLIRYLLCMLLFLYAAVCCLTIQLACWDDFCFVARSLSCCCERMSGLHTASNVELSLCKSRSFIIGALLYSSSCPLCLALLNTRLNLQCCMRCMDLICLRVAAQSISLLRPSAANTQGTAHHHALIPQSTSGV